MLSTGSTLLDLSISGGRVRGGGIPPGIIIVFIGPSGTGKSAFLCSVLGDAKRRGGEVHYKDPECRLDPMHAKVAYGLELDEEREYSMPGTVGDLFKDILGWGPKGKGPHAMAVDSFASLCGEAEAGADPDGMAAMRRAAEFSQGMRRAKARYKGSNMVLVASDQIRENPNALPGQKKWSEGGGKALEFYPSVRVYMRPGRKLKREAKTSGGVKLEQPYGVLGEAEIIKSSVDKPFRRAPFRIIFDYGVDDIGANLQWIKDMTKDSRYWTGHQSLDDAIVSVEGDGIGNAAILELRETTIGLWEEIEALFRTGRRRSW
jgi:RecA/RadA recombinase